jgi:hypothetical protein
MVHAFILTVPIREFHDAGMLGVNLGVPATMAFSQSRL